MRSIYPPHHTQHRPPFEVYNGHADSHQEIPGRVDRIISALQHAGFPLEEVSSVVPHSLLAEVHSSAYLEFLATTQSLDATYHYPSVFPYNTKVESTHWLAQFGQHSFDLYTPVAGTTWQAAIESASCAYEAADALLTGSIQATYALCRPPGHHAESGKMGGYCYLANAAIAAHHLSHHGRVATLDIDFHHGNGTQHIFYDRSDVLTISLHADPDWKFPFFSGFSQETGIGQGEGYNLNLPLPAQTTNEQYQEALQVAIQRIKNFSPEYLVVSLGADIHVSDPIGGFLITTAYFRELGKQLAELDLPTVIVQEGGYNTELLGTNVVTFLDGLSR